MDLQAAVKRKLPNITHVRRIPATVPQKEQVTPSVDEEPYKAMSNLQTTETHSQPMFQTTETHSQSMSQKDPPHLATLTPLPAIHTDAATLNGIKLSPSEPKRSHLIETKQSFGGLRRWYSGLTSKQKLSLRVGIVVGVSIVWAIVIILPLVLLIALRQSSSTTTTTTAATVISASWSFDNVTTDLYGVYNGAIINGATYLTAATNLLYLGDGEALSLTSASNQSFLVSSPFLNLAYTSFTVEAWIYPTVSLVPDHGIFSQCSCSTCSNQCLYMILRAGKLYMSFTFNDVAGSTALSLTTWYHVAFVYNYATQQQILYLNGVQDAITSHALPYQGRNGSIQIGAAQEFTTMYYFDGYIDNLKLVTRAKSSTEILYDASVTAYYSFDLPFPNNDNGPNGLNGSSASISVITGRVNQAMRFIGLASYFQAYGFYQLDYSITSGKPFSISLWINPSSFTSCTIVQINKQQTSTSCYNLMGIIGNNALSGQLITKMSSGQIMYGPFLTLNTWTHVSLTYSFTNGTTLYVNGILFGSYGSFNNGASSSITWLQIGCNFQCTMCCQGISSNAYQGSIDEIYIHSRELTQSDVTALANP